MPIKLVVFDCDGVLVDSEIIANEELREALHVCGLSMSISQVVETFVGLSMATVVHIAQRMLGHDLPNDFLDRLQEKTFAAFKERLEPVKAVREVLEFLSQSSYEVCVASSGSFDKIALTLGLTNLKHFFGDNIFNSSQVTRGKPYPDLYLFTAEKMGYDPSECLVIEDSLPGVQGAVAAGMEVMAYSVRGQDNSLATAGGMIIQDMRDVIKYLD